MKRRTLLGLAPFGLLPSISQALTTSPDKYPERAVSLIVAYVAGGSADQRMRQIGRFLSDAYGRTFVVNNHPGAAGNIGTDLIARAKPDGYTLGMGNLAPLAVNSALDKRRTFNPLKDLTFIALVERGPLMLVVRPNASYRSVSDLVAASRAKPGGLSFGSSGTGSAHHLCGELLKAATGADMTHVPYKGGFSAVIDLEGGQLDFVFEPMYSALPAVRAGKLRALALTSRHRSPLAPEVPTMVEAGVPNFHVENWQGLVGPAGVPDAIVRSLNAAVNRALADPSIKSQMLSQGNEVGGGSPHDFQTLVKAESVRWAEVVSKNRIVAE